MTPLADDELYALFVKVGFPRSVVVDPPEGKEDRAAMMTAIALRESGGNPYAFNGNAATGDQSYGLVQINWMVPEIKALSNKSLPSAAQYGYLPEVLFNAETNAKIAFRLYANNRHFMDTLWYIDRPGTARDRYLALLPRGLAAAARYTPTA